MAEPIRTYTVKKVSDELDCSADTIRRYTSEFGQFLSESAQPGSTRLFTDEDLFYLRAARRFLLEGHTYEQAREHLETLSPPPDVGEQNLAEARTDLATTAGFQQITAALYALADQRDRTDEMERRLDALSEARSAQQADQARLQAQLDQIARHQEQSARQPSPWLLVAIGAFVSALVVLAAVAAALAMGWIG